MYESLFNSPSHLFGHFEQLRRELDDLFGGSGPSGIRSVAAGSAPAVNIGRTERSVEVYAFAPGLDASKIDVSIDRGVLRISGERKRGVPQGDSEMQVYSRERASGSFSRALSLPDDIDPDKVEAIYRDGVLQISVARREAARPKRIDVQ